MTHEQHGHIGHGHGAHEHGAHHHGHDGHDHAGSEADRFDAEAATWDDDPAKLERARNTAALLREQLPLTGSERVLEIGGGTGRLSLDLADAVAGVTVSDASAGMVEVARSNIEAAGLADRFTAVQLNLLADPDPAGAPFDGVWSQLAWHHVADPDALLGRVRDVLAPGGWLAVIELDADPAGDFHANVDGFTGPHGFDRDGFAEQMRAAGFVDVTVADGGSVEKELDGKGRQNFGMFLAVGYAPRS